MYFTKPGVKLQGITPQWMYQYIVVGRAFDFVGHDCILTSACDGEHGRKSAHNTGRAADYRTRHLSAGEKSVLLETVRQALGDEFDVLLEAVSTPNEHLHVEFDPK